MPPYPSGIVTPNSPSSFICSTTASGNESSWSCSSAIGITCSSTNCRTISVIARCSSVCSEKAVATAKAGLLVYGLTRESILRRALPGARRDGRLAAGRRHPCGVLPLYEGKVQPAGVLPPGDATARGGGGGAG